MIYTTKIHKAIKFATKTHEVYQKQKRKGKDIAYVVHPLTVGIILSQASASEDVIVAGILHDTIEDSTDEKKVTVEMLEKRFGTHVAQSVLSVTETDRTLSWEDRKRHALEHIHTFSHDSLLIKSADVLANGTELIDDHVHCGDEVFDRFTASKDEMITNQLKVIALIMQRWETNPLIEDLRALERKLQEIAS